MSSQKTKGDNFERELAKHINDYLGKPDLCARAPLSGGGAIGVLSGGADLIGPPDLFVEAKRVERLSFPAALEQAERNARATRTFDIPVVINRRNRQTTGQSYVLLRLDNFLELYRAYLILTGALKKT